MTWVTDVLGSVDGRTSVAWFGVMLGFAYFAWLAVARFFDGPTRGRASIVAFSTTGIVVAATAVLIRTNTFDIHDRVTEHRTEAFCLALWWMIWEFRRGNIVTREDCPTPWGQSGAAWPQEERRRIPFGRRFADRPAETLRGLDD